MRRSRSTTGRILLAVVAAIIIAAFLARRIM